MNSGGISRKQGGKSLNVRATADRSGVGDGVIVGVSVDVAVGVGVGVLLGVTVGVGVGEGVGVAVSVGVSVGVAVLVGVGASAVSLAKKVAATSVAKASGSGGWRQAASRTTVSKMLPVKIACVLTTLSPYSCSPSSYSVTWKVLKA
jgi:hypothetical protein